MQGTIASGVVDFALSRWLLRYTPSKLGKSVRRIEEEVNWMEVVDGGKVNWMEVVDGRKGQLRGEHFIG